MWAHMGVVDKEKEMEYVKVKKEDLIKVHKESCGDVKKVLEGLYPGELNKFAKLDPRLFTFNTEKHLLTSASGVFIRIDYNGEYIGFVSEITADGDKYIPHVRKQAGLVSEITLEQK